MKIKTMMIAAMAAMTLAACSKDGENGSAVDDGVGADARLNIAFTVPTPAAAPETRASQDAHLNESEVTHVSVYLFKASNGVALKGNNTHLDIADFDATGVDGLGNDNKFKLESGKEIETTAGIANIYVILNHPEYGTAAADYAGEGALLKAIADVDDMIVVKNFTMFAQGKNQQLKPFDPDGITNVQLTASRVVSKIVTTLKTSADLVVKWYESDQSTVFNTLTYTVEGYGVYQEGIASYLAAQSPTLSPFTSTAFSPYAKSVLNPNKAVMTGNYTNNDGVIHTLTNGWYVAENIPTANNTLNKNTTYVMIATRVKLDKFAKLNATGDIEWNTAAYVDQTNFKDDLYVTTYLGASYVSNVKQDIVDICLAIDGNTGTQKYYTYPEGYVHFQRFLNPDATINNYAVKRNQFIHVNITGIKNFNGYFPGYPGGDGENGNPDPDKPIDPTENNGENPDPIDPEEKVDPEKALISIEITIADWDYVENEFEME